MAKTPDPKGPPPAGGKVLSRGSPIHGANGIFFDDNDVLHIASVMGREVVVMDPRNGRILNRLGPDVGVEAPDDLTFGPDGSLYWTAFISGEVGRMKPDGQTTRQFVAPSVNPVTVSDEGRLFVATCFGGEPNTLWELDPELTNPPRLITSALGPGCALNGMDFGPDGYLYGPRWFLKDVVKVDVETGAFWPVAAGFGTPAAVKFDSRGQLHVLDALRGEVVQVDPTSGGRTVVTRIMPGLDNIAFDSQDNLFVSSFTDGFIARILPSGKHRLLSRGGMIGPGGVAVVPSADGRESVFVADFFSLREFDGLTGRPKSVERHVIGEPPIESPSAVSADGGNLVLTSMFSNIVQVWDPENRQELEHHANFLGPQDAVRFQGDIAVTQSLTGNVVWASDRSAIAGGFAWPVGLAATGDDLWVSDLIAGIVWQIVADGVPAMNPVAMGLQGPEGIAVDVDGGLLVIESGAHRVSRIDLASGEVSTVAEGLELGLQPPAGFFPSFLVNGVAAGPSGTVYVTGDIGNVLYRFRSNR